MIHSTGYQICSQIALLVLLISSGLIRSTDQLVNGLSPIRPISSDNLESLSSLAKRIRKGPHSNELYLNHFPQTLPDSSSASSPLSSLGSESSHQHEIAVNQTAINRLLVNPTLISKPLLVDRKLAEKMINISSSPSSSSSLSSASASSTSASADPFTHKKGLLLNSDNSDSSGDSVSTLNPSASPGSANSSSIRQVSPLIYLSRDQTSGSARSGRSENLSMERRNGTVSSDSAALPSESRRGQLSESNLNEPSSQENPINYTDTYNKNRYSRVKMGSSLSADDYRRYRPTLGLTSSASSVNTELASRPSQPISYSSQSAPRSYGYNRNSSPSAYPSKPINSSEIDAMVAQLRASLRPKAYPVPRFYSNQYQGSGDQIRFQKTPNDYFRSASSTIRGFSSPISSTSSLGSPASSMTLNSPFMPFSSSASVSSSSIINPQPLSSSENSGSQDSMEDGNSGSSESGNGNSGQDEMDQPYNHGNYQASQANSAQENPNGENEGFYPSNNHNSQGQHNGNNGPNMGNLQPSGQYGTSGDYANSVLNYGKFPNEQGPNSGYGLSPDFTVSSGPDPSAGGLGQHELSHGHGGPGSEPGVHFSSLGQSSFQLDPQFDQLMSGHGGPGSGFGKSPHEYIHNYYEPENNKDKFRFANKPLDHHNPHPHGYYNDYTGHHHHQPVQPSNYGQQNTMKDFMRVVDSVKHVVYKMKPLKTVASKMYRDFTDKMKRRIKSFRGPSNGLPSISHQPQMGPIPHPVPIGHGAIPLGGTLGGGGVPNPGGFQGMASGINPIALQAMAELTGAKLPMLPTPNMGSVSTNGGSGLPPALLAALAGGGGNGGGMGDISGLINSYLGGKDQESNNMEDELMNELNQALISQLISGLKLRRKDDENGNSLTSHSSSSRKNRQNDDEEDSDSDSDDEKFTLNRRVAGERSSQDETTDPTSHELINSPDNLNLTSGQLNKPEVENNSSETVNLPVKFSKTIFGQPKKTRAQNKEPKEGQSVLMASESAQFGVRIKPKTNKPPKVVASKTNAPIKVTFSDSAQTSNKSVSVRTKRSAQIFIQNPNGPPTFIANNRDIIDLFPGKGFSAIPNSHHSDFGLEILLDKIPIEQRAMFSKMLSTINKAAQKGDLTGLNGSINGLTEARSNLKPYFWVHDSTDQIIELTTDENGTRVRPKIPSIPNLVNLLDSDETANDLKSNPENSSSAPEIHLKIIEITPTKSDKRPFNPSVISSLALSKSKPIKINGKVHFPLANEALKSLLKRLPSPVIRTGSNSRPRPIIDKPNRIIALPGQANMRLGFKFPVLPLKSLSPNLIETVKKAKFLFQYPPSSSLVSTPFHQVIESSGQQSTTRPLGNIKSPASNPLIFVVVNPNKQREQYQQNGDRTSTLKQIEGQPRPSQGQITSASIPNRTFHFPPNRVNQEKVTESTIFTSTISTPTTMITTDKIFYPTSLTYSDSSFWSPSQGQLRSIDGSTKKSPKYSQPLIETQEKMLRRNNQKWIPKKGR